MAVSDTVQQIIDNAIETANDAQADAVGFSNTAITAAQTVASVGSVGFTFDPTVPDLGVIIPSVASEDSQPLFQSLYGQIKTDLEAAFVTFFNTYFPNECDYLEHAQQWLCDTITLGGTGIPAGVEDQIWQRERSRILQEANRVESEIVTQWASRGFPLPTGPAVWAVYQTQQASQNQVSDSSRVRAIENAKIEIENVRFAVQQALGLRVNAVQAAAAYINALARAADVGSVVSRNASSAQAELINAAVNYYRARLVVEEIKYNVRAKNAELDLQGAQADVSAFAARSSNVTSAATAAADSAGRIAAAALTALHSQATLSSVEHTSA
jgi:hypothetical protein